MNHHPVPTGLPEYRFPTEPWRLVERELRNDDLGLTETIFAVGNGYLGMRANPEEGRSPPALIVCVTPPRSINEMVFDPAFSAAIGLHM